MFNIFQIYNFSRFVAKRTICDAEPVRFQFSEMLIEPSVFRLPKCELNQKILRLCKKYFFHDNSCTFLYLTRLTSISYNAFVHGSAEVRPCHAFVTWDTWIQRDNKWRRKSVLRSSQFYVRLRISEVPEPTSATGKNSSFWALNKF